MAQLLEEPPTCVQDAGSWCQQVWQLTKNEWLAASADWLVAKPLRIVLTILVAVLLRWLLRKLIHRLTTVQYNGNGKLPVMLRSLRERGANGGRDPRETDPVTVERRRQRAETIGSLLKSITSFVIFGLAFILILGELGVDLAPILTSAGIVGVALGFGAQSLVKDFLSGIFMMLEDQYGVGDVIDIGEAVGTVETVGLRITTVRDLGGTVWYIRNGEVLRVGNFNQGYAVAVVDIPFGYTADVTKASATLRSVAEQAAREETIAPDVLAAPTVLGVEDITPESVQFRVTMKVRAGRQWAVQRALRAEIMRALEREGFEPPLIRLLAGRRHTDNG